MTDRSHWLAAALLLAPCGAGFASSVSYQFGGNSNGIAGLSTAAVTESGVTMSLATTIPGARFNENGSRGLGSSSRAVAGAVDPEVDRFNVLGGTLDGQTEGMTFSFDVNGVLDDLLFDGLSDEAFEFFRLETPGGQVLSFFDSEVPLRVLDISSIDEPNVTLLEEIGAPDDDAFGLGIPFQAGEVFTLVYGEYQPDPSELTPGFTPNNGNGGRFEGVAITVVPEPAAGLLCGIALGGATSACRTSRRSRK